MEEKILVKRAKQGDVEAFAILYERIYVKLYKFALYTLKNTQDAEDVVSETVADGFENIKKLRKDESFSSWLFRILSNKCKQKIGQYYIQRQQISQEELNCSMLPTEQENWGSKEEYMDIRNCFFQLKDDERLIIAMHLFLGYKTREIAEILQINENTIRSRESRAIKKLGNMLEE